MLTCAVYLDPFRVSLPEVSARLYILLAFSVVIPSGLDAEPLEVPLRECVRRTSDTKPFAEMVYHADKKGQISKIDVKYEGRAPMSYQYVWKDSQIVADKGLEGRWNLVRRSQRGLVEHYRGYSYEVGALSVAAGRENAPVNAAPMHVNAFTMATLGQQPWAIPGFSGTVKQVNGGVYFRRDTIYENGRMVRWIDQPSSSKYKKITAEIAWDSEGRMASVTIKPRRKKGTRGFRFVWDEKRLRTVELLDKKKKFYRYEYDKAGRIRQLVIEGVSKKPITFTYQHKCHNIQPHPALNGIDMYQYSRR